jgi:NADH-quinone oxidoreductase subunit E
VLTEEERQQIEADIPHYVHRKAACIDALKIVQQHRGWLSDEAIRDVAGCLGMDPAELDGVASFYTMLFREPVGKHLVMLCDSVSCWIMGYERVREALKTRLGVDFGGTSADGRFTFLPIVCLGACDHAPAMLVDDDLHGNLEPEEVASILDGYTE